MVHDGSAKAKRSPTSLRGETLASPAFRPGKNFGVQARIADTKFFR